MKFSLYGANMKEASTAFALFIPVTIFLTMDIQLLWDRCLSVRLKVFFSFLQFSVGH